MSAPGAFRLFGHPLHPMLSDFPLALLLMVPVWDGVALLRASAGTLFWAISFYTLVAGIAGGLVAAAAGMIDYAAIPERAHKASQTATRHMIVMLVAVSAYGSAIAVRGGPAPLQGGKLVAELALEGFGTVALLVGGWLGGELVFGLGVGTRRGPED